MLVFMVRGLFLKLEFPYAQFPCDSLAGEQLFPIVWGCVERLEACGFKVIALTADGASCNRKFFKMHQSENETEADNEGSEADETLSDELTVTYKTTNVYSSDQRPLFFRCSSFNQDREKLLVKFFCSYKKQDSSGI